MKVSCVKVHDLLHGEAESEGTAVLVDRLWPRGVAKKDLHHDLWLKDVAPSPELRRWFDHDPAKFDEFTRRYRAELDEAYGAGNGDVDTLLELGDVTLLYAAHDREHNHAVVLAAWIKEQKWKPH